MRAIGPFTNDLGYTPDPVAPTGARFVAPPWDRTVPAPWQLAEQTAVGPMYTHRDDLMIGDSLRNTGDWDSKEREFIERHLGPGMGAIDVGANIGSFTRAMATRVGPEGTVVAIEAAPGPCAMLQANLALGGISNTTILAVAVGRATGTVTMALPDPANLGSFWAIGKGQGQTEVPLRRLDDLLNPDARVDFIKIDVQGFDIDVVHGALETIRRWRPTVLLEVEPEILAKRRLDPVAEIASLTAAGLDVSVAPWTLQRLRESRRGRAVPREVLTTEIVPGNERQLVWLCRGSNLTLVVRCPDPVNDASLTGR